MSPRNLSAKNKIPKLLNLKLKNKRIRQIYREFSKSFNIEKNFIVAVSGGPDSLALAFLSKIYSIKKKLIVKFYIVDHKLRPESTNEAKQVVKILKKFKIDVEILTWKGKKPAKNVQSLARAERYRLLLSKCDKFKIKNILLGHHQNDLIENFFIRMLRGSGLKGLVSLDKESRIGDKILFRPLLNQKKRDLEFVAKFVFNFYAEDPSNKEQKYQRVKVRKFLKDLEKEGLDERKFMKTITNLKSSNDVVSFYAKENLNKNTHFSILENKIIINLEFFQQPYEVIFRAFSESIKLINKKYYSVRGKKMDKIINEIENKRSFRVTLGGCIIEKVNQTVIISKEY